MSKGFSRTVRLDLAGLDAAPPQVLGNVRLVPLLRREVRPDLRLARRTYEEPLGVVGLDGDEDDPDLAYASFIPHGLVASWSNDGADANLGAALGPRDGKPLGRFARLHHRMAKREDDRALRFLPLHLAMEGFLSLCFAGPDVVWPEYTRRAVSRGLSPRVELSRRGAFLPGLADALRIFEIHERQTGVLVFLADALASAFVVPHPDDYRALHRSLLEDFYGPLLVDYGLYYPELAPAHTAVDADAVRSLADLGAGVARMRREWADFAALLASGVLHREARAEDVYRLGPFRLERFVTDLQLHEENHIGERIVRADGTVEYLKTYRLSDAQTRRAYLLQKLHAHGWNLAKTAEALRTSVSDLVCRVEAAGFGYLFKPDVLALARRGVG
jgi:hypothetical protein